MGRDERHRRAAAWSGEPRRVHGVDDAVGLFARGADELCIVHATGARTCSANRSPGTTVRYPWDAEERCEVDLAGDVWCTGSNLRGERGCDVHDVPFAAWTRVWMQPGRFSVRLRTRPRWRAAASSPGCSQASSN